jgi:hypothetical protein
MPRMPTFEEIRADFERGVRTAEQHIEHPFRHQTSAAHAAATATTTEDHMSVITDVEDGWNALKGEVAKFEAGLPAGLAKAKQFESSPFALLAEKVAGTVLPPEAVAIAVNAAEKVLDDLIGLYAPAQAAQPQQPVQA